MSSHQNFANGIYRKAKRANLFTISLLKSLFDNSVFNDVENYCMFIGYPRSGHSLIGSLLDAHPEMVIAHELDALLYVNYLYNKYHLYHMLLGKSRSFSKSGRRWTGYSYEVPGQWQSNFRRLRVIGDKKGGRSALRLQANPKLLSRLFSIVGKDAKFIHVIRDPFDNISTIYEKDKYFGFENLKDSIQLYFSLCKTIGTVKQQINKDNIYDIHLESFIADPQGNLHKLCQFLEVETSSGYLKSCGGVVFDAPRKTRDQVDWSTSMIRLVNERMCEFSFLHKYLS